MSNVVIDPNLKCGTSCNALAMKASRAAVTLAAVGLLLLPQRCLAARWQELGWATAAAAGLVYVDLDSIHQEGAYRIARFLTIYAEPATNSSGIRMDRLLQQTAFECNQHRFTFLSTIAYFEGRKIGGSSPADDWADRSRPVPLDSYSQHAFTVACTSPVASSTDFSADGDSPGTEPAGPGCRCRRQQVDAEPAREPVRIRFEDTQARAATRACYTPPALNSARFPASDTRRG